ncbi:hypothetical protein NEUTE1DRAFT_42707 [Neurospora tetrasperma FGSC 2508]|uniref:Uncharacterized protein n=1 Tax=Neurospora tetrasperma (strain FGSC 2508 / ATCC MYA-4615 / P0657) TaxID=510951 RepID=F8MK83_NEUT8|nr:uncharacterized protein NEUTE1DRAFT_42707 [Neurospora tetrasperma FGSC 2508]EGO57367.1 hypothetical protein NEUTE1DRAFT_42707 [Neurospora tetrasperma FGSC 2508]EGZ72380.1 hypothetical protein NEUTE2DRAFT_66474 [Neurospora tetrasperma FGSC 2509]
MKANLLFVALAIRYAALAATNWDIYGYGIVDTFRWSRPFPDDGTDPGGFLVNCRAEGTFHAMMYKLSDLLTEPPEGLSPWHDAIEDFLGRRSYMGSWDGVDHKGHDREIVVMEYAGVPGPARDWIENQQRDTSKTDDGKWMFAVFRKPENQTDKVTGTVKPALTREAADAHKASPISAKNKIVVFPAGAIYEILPLWVSKGSKCEPWVTSHTKPRRDLGNRDITFKIEAMAVTETEEGKHTRLMWEKMHRTIRRNERRMQRGERQKVRKELNEGRFKDEL